MSSLADFSNGSSTNETDSLCLMRLKTARFSLRSLISSQMWSSAVSGD